MPYYTLIENFFATQKFKSGKLWGAIEDRTTSTHHHDPLGDLPCDVLLSPTDLQHWPD